MTDAAGANYNLGFLFCSQCVAMPIYAYRCGSCGFQKDVLQKMSDAPLTQCPECKQESFSKQVTAAGFQLKGSGWYVTDFRGGNSSSGKSDKKEGSSSGASESGQNSSTSAGASAQSKPAPAAGSGSE